MRYFFTSEDKSKDMLTTAKLKDIDEARSVADHRGSVLIYRRKGEKMELVSYKCEQDGWR